MEALGLPLSRRLPTLLDRHPKGYCGEGADVPARGHRVRLAVWVIRYQAPPTGEGRRVVYICAE